jgi:hypothetical protein
MEEKNEIRKSTRFLLSIPVLFGLTLLCTFLLIITFLRLIEEMAVSKGAITDYLDYFALIIALLVSIDGLIIMMWEYGLKRTDETRIMNYLAKVDAKREAERARAEEIWAERQKKMP